MQPHEPRDDARDESAEPPFAVRWRLEELRPEDVRTLRDSAVRQVTAWGYLADDMAIVASELLTNVLQHAPGRVELHVQAMRNWLFVAAGDRSTRRPRLPEPDVKPDVDAGSGRGMYLVAQLATHWHVQPTLTGKLVWALLPLTRLCEGCSRTTEARRAIAAR